jgi:folate-binding protein YgfZ
MSTPSATTTTPDVSATPVRPSVLLERVGAVAGDPPDAGVAAHYGEPLKEQALPAAVVDRSHREVVSVTGPDRLSWLHSLTSQHVEALAAGVGTEGLILSPHGHVEHHFGMVDDGTSTWLDVEPGAAEPLLTYLNKMVFMLRVENARADRAVLTVVGDPAPDQHPAEWLAHRMPWGTDLLIPRAEVASAVDALGLPLMGHAAFEALRVEARRPRLGFETDHRTIPNELPWLETAVHLHKGCYRGQETVARTHNLGRPPRRLVLLHFDGALPVRDAPVELDGRAVGRLGTPAYSAELGPIGLAVLKRNVPDDAQLTVGGIAAAIDPA